MNFREMNQRVFAGQPNPQVLFQPRIEPWYAWHKTFDSLPPPYDDMSLLDLFDDLGCSIRYVDYYTGMPHPVVEFFQPEVEIRKRVADNRLVRSYETPHGELTEVLKRTQDDTWRTVEFAVKDPADFQKLRWLYQRRVATFSPENFEQGRQFIGDRGEPQFWITRSPYQALALDWMRYEQFIYALADHRSEVEDTLAVIDHSYDRLYEEILAYGEVRIINFGENIHAHLVSPKNFERYLLPFYEKRCHQLQTANIFTHIHIDGACHALLPYLKDLPFDGIEALTPQPQGDVSLHQIKEHIGDKVLLDGIPAVYFLPTYSRDDLMTCVEELVNLFHPRLVLGVSDEVPEGAGAEAMERVRLVAVCCRQHANI